MHRQSGDDNRKRPAKTAARRFWAFARRLSRPGFGESGDLCDEGFGVVGFGIEVVADPFCQLGVAFVLGICDGVEQFGIAKGPPQSSGGQRPLTSIRRG